MKNLFLSFLLTTGLFTGLLGGFSSWALAETTWFPLPKEAYSFGKLYPEAQSLLFGFDYGHALIYEKLLLNKGKITHPEKFEADLLKQILAILKSPPSTKVSENDIAPHYTYEFPLTTQLFDWSHDLHQFIYDVLATSEDRGAGMNKRVEEIFAQYQANHSIAITERCKTVDFMHGHYFSKAFKKTYYSLNLLIWSYHWLQIKLYEALMAPSRAERDVAVTKVVKDFRMLIGNLPDSNEMVEMPFTAEEAPSFAKAFPALPSTFDNLHMLHDVVSDLLTSDLVSRENIKNEAIRFSRMALDPDAFKSAQCPVGN